MVLLTITDSILEALRTAEALGDQPKLESRPDHDNEPSLEDPKSGNPISHGQIIDLWKLLKEKGEASYKLETLLRGSRVYSPPPPPKVEPSDEYKALMARLRRQEEQRAYERMTNPLPPTETFAQRHPSGRGMAHAFAEANRPTREEDIGDDGVTYNDVHRQLMLILNVLLSVLGVAATLWTLARWWSTPARLFLAMGGSVLVGVAEVVLYSGYIWHLGEAKKKDTKFKEVKQVVQTWTVGAESDQAREIGVVAPATKSHEDANIRRRKGK
ncbi:endoplasmic reticulum-based factor for assembly of V-ATPase-domain-containing protein [Rhypophila decipiens]|uniref:Endoplasmic reticulum-based factor for assembly of V-ATPase-domain-containing protein n=1 Tax=Rhypophila decipiens TaxID=261697 RepID=A0AAN6YH38_9PEZI|nr:endoplasmic reticulum-based factor for assembly of V-ATPase-domain-containing protein [Rhypophila decipiens]